MTKAETESQYQRNKAIVDTKGLSIPEESARKVSLLNILALLMFSLGIGLIVYVIYLFAYPFNPLVIKNVTVTTPTVQAGGTMIYKITSCKNTQDTPMVYKKIVSADSSQSFPAVQGVVQPGCSTTQVPVHILAGTPPGEYRLYTEVVYSISALRQIHIFWHTGPFQVTN